MNQNELDRALVNFSRSGNFAAVEELCLWGANPKAWDSEALLEAAENGHLDIVKFLIQRGANPKARSNAPLRWAYFRQQKEVSYYLKLVIFKGRN